LIGVKDITVTYHELVTRLRLWHYHEIQTGFTATRGHD